MADSNPTLTPQSVIQTYQRAKERRRLWESHWNHYHTGAVNPPWSQGRSAEKSIKTWKE